MVCFVLVEPRGGRTRGARSVLDRVGPKSGMIAVNNLRKVIRRVGSTSGAIMLSYRKVFLAFRGHTVSHVSGITAVAASSTVIRSFATARARRARRSGGRRWDSLVRQGKKTTVTYCVERAV